MKVCKLCGSSYDDRVDFCFRDGTPLGKKGLFNRLMSEKRWSDTASYEVKRGEEKVTLVAKFVRKPKEAPKAEGPAK